MLAGNFFEARDHRRSAGPSGRSPSSRISSVWRASFSIDVARWNVSLSDALADLGDDVGPLRDAEHVEDQGDSAVAHDRRAGERGDAFELLAERLDDDLLGVVDLVDDEAELAVVGLEHDDVDDVAVGSVVGDRDASFEPFSSRFR